MTDLNGNIPVVAKKFEPFDCFSFVNINAISAYTGIQRDRLHRQLKGTTDRLGAEEKEDVIKLLEESIEDVKKLIQKG